jgi:hypothetical protein
MRNRSTSQTKSRNFTSSPQKRGRQDHIELLSSPPTKETPPKCFLDHVHHHDEKHANTEKVSYLARRDSKWAREKASKNKHDRRSDISKSLEQFIENESFDAFGGRGGTASRSIISSPGIQRPKLPSRRSSLPVRDGKNRQYPCKPVKQRATSMIHPSSTCGRSINGKRNTSLDMHLQKMNSSLGDMDDHDYDHEEHRSIASAPILKNNEKLNFKF